MPKPSERTTVKKSLHFDNNSDIPPALIPSAAPSEISPASNEAEEEIIKHDTVTQTALTVPITEGASDQGSATTAEPIEMTATDTSESPEEGAALPTTPSQGVGWPLRRTKKFCSVYLTKSTKGKQFQPRSPISNRAVYPIVRYQHAA